MEDRTRSAARIAALPAAGLAAKRHAAGPRRAEPQPRRPGAPGARAIVMALSALLLCAAGGAGALAHDPPGREDERPLFEGWPEELFDPDKFDKRRLTEEARRAVEELLALVGPLMDQLSIAIEDLPRYEAPVILPNGDILIRRKRDGGPDHAPDAAPPRRDGPAPGDPDDPRLRPDGSYEL